MEYYILVFFYVNKAHVITLALSACLPLPIHLTILNLLASVYKHDRLEEVPRIFQPHNFQEIIYLGKQVDEESLPRAALRKGL